MVLLPSLFLLPLLLLPLTFTPLLLLPLPPFFRLTPRGRES